MEIDLKYKIKPVGEYNPAIYECPCGANLIDRFHSHAIGFADTNIGLVMVTECPYCFKKFYSHANEISYSIFLDFIRLGKNKFYK